MDVFRANSYTHRPQTCRYFLQGRCHFGHKCRNVHPTTSQRHPTPSSSHRRNERQSQASSSATTAPNSVDQERTCGICFDVILNKIKSEQVFGILPNCNHCFCFTCIRKWRSSKEFNLDVSKACPECRVTSDFVYPSRCWVTTKEEKDKLISERKSKMAQIDCKYFRKGKGKCPFGNMCLYQHSLPNGEKVDVGPPRPRRDSSRINLNNLTDFLVYITNHISDVDDDFFYSDEDENWEDHEDFYDLEDYENTSDEDDDEMAFYTHQGMLFELL